MQYTVRFNSHRYPDCSDAARSETCIVVADDDEQACQMVRDRRDIARVHSDGRRLKRPYIGLVHSAEQRV